MIKIYNNIIPVKGFKAMNLFGILFVRKGQTVDAVTENHEQIHTEQMKELLFIPFYLLYVLEWLIKVPIHGFKFHEAYRNISFEKEAYAHQKELDYVKNDRKHYNWFKLIWK